MCYCNRHGILGMVFIVYAIAGVKENIRPCWHTTSQPGCCSAIRCCCCLRKIIILLGPDSEQTQTPHHTTSSHPPAQPQLSCSQTQTKTKTLWYKNAGRRELSTGPVSLVSGFGTAFLPCSEFEWSVWKFALKLSCSVLQLSSCWCGGAVAGTLPLVAPRG